MKKYFLVGLVLSFIGVYGQNGSLDPTFNSTGYKTWHFNSVGNVNDDYGSYLLRQTDGKYIMLDKYSYQYGYPVSTLVRFKANGTIDSSYGVNGFSGRGNDPDLTSAAIQKDDKVILAGYSYKNSGATYAATRYNTNGSIDNTFGINGYVYVNMEPTSSYTRVQSDPLITIDSSGRIVITAQVMYYDDGTSNYVYEVATLRLTETGAVDETFNGGISKIIVGYEFFPRAVAIDTAGKIIIGGQALYDNGSYSYYIFALTRILSDGSQPGTQDLSFGTNGFVQTDPGYYSYLSALTVQKDNKILAAGITEYYHPETDEFLYQGTLIRYLNDDSGNPDTTFNAGATHTGTVFNRLGANTYLMGISVRDNQIVVGGFTEFKPPLSDTYLDSLAIIVYKNDGINDGVPDESFGTGGMLRVNITNRDRGISVLTQSDGNIVVGGYAYNEVAYNNDLLLVRFTGTGAWDNSFNGNGQQLAYFSPGANCMITAAAVQPDGKIVFAGTNQPPDNWSQVDEFVVARFNPDGTLDQGFGSGGWAVADFGSRTSAWAFSVAIAPAGAPNAGKIIVGGSLRWSDDYAEYEDFALAQFTSAGILDESFHGDGKLVSDLSSNVDRIFSLAIQPRDGKIVAGGPSLNYNDYNLQDFLLARYTTAGALDASFGSTGTVTVDFMGGGDVLGDLVLQPDGKIIAAGLAIDPNTSLSSFALVRLSANGTPDRRFGTNGKVTTFLPENYAGAISLVLQNDGKILTGGYFTHWSGTADYLGLVRYTSAGALDGTFASGGVATFTFEGYRPLHTIEYKEGPSVALQNDGKILLANPLEPLNQEPFYYKYGVARFTTTGVPDSTWGTDGQLISSFQQGDTYLHSAIWNDSRLYTMGNYYQNIDDNSASFIAAYTAGEPKQLPPSISINDIKVAEGSTATLTVTMDKTYTSAITVNYATKDGTASSKGKNPDFKSTKGTITFAMGQTSANISVPTFLDNNIESPENFSVTISLSAQMAKLVSLAKATGTVTITDGVGLMDETTMRKDQGREQNAIGALAVKAMPNPSSSAFTLQWQSASSAPVNISVMDISGRLVEYKTGVAANSSLRLGANYLPGAYYAEVVQGAEKVVVKLLKQ